DAAARHRGRAPGDNVVIEIDPATFFRYDMPIPIDHPLGLLWYHPTSTPASTPRSPVAPRWRDRREHPGGVSRAGNDPGTRHAAEGRVFVYAVHGTVGGSRAESASARRRVGEPRAAPPPRTRCRAGAGSSRHARGGTPPRSSWSMPAGGLGSRPVGATRLHVARGPAVPDLTVAAGVIGAGRRPGPHRRQRAP